MVFISVTGSDKRHLLRLAALVLDLKALCFLGAVRVVRSKGTLLPQPFVTIPRFALSSVSFKNDVCFSILPPFFGGDRVLSHLCLHEIGGFLTPHTHLLVATWEERPLDSFCCF